MLLYVINIFFVYTLCGTPRDKHHVVSRVVLLMGGWMSCENRARFGNAADDDDDNDMEGGNIGCIQTAEVVINNR